MDLILYVQFLASRPISLCVPFSKISVNLPSYPYTILFVVEGHFQNPFKKIPPQQCGIPTWVK